ncbi:glycosyl hydrolase family 28-related protein [Pediococcus pentosaceus]|uniref:glycosyl hydrolase family 28-related protein n=1 Tax=Pediococcus pentosaceus TaxID=1255 RepID=UPI0021F0996F|nr:glycosyl hydrolase family 28-related protein [Pediococcus pentosaceus]MCS8573778.1 hypothetical protein [Pediococcus pentosaceus]
MINVIEDEASIITLDTYKRDEDVGEAFNLSISFNGRVGDEQVPFPVKFLERGKAQQFEDGLVPFMSGFVGNLDDDGKVTAETGEPVSYTGSRDDIVGLGMVKMNLPGTMFPQEGYFYGFLGLETPDHSKRVSTFSVWFHVYNGNPDMFVNKEPFRSELQKELDRVEVLIEQTEGTIKAKLIEWEKLINDLITNKNVDLGQLESRMATAAGNLKILEEKIKADGLLTQAELDVFMSTFINSETLDLEFADLSKRAEFYDKSLAQSGVNVSWFNPPMDGVNDDSVAIQAAIDFADENGFKKVIIPDGDYLMLENIYLKSNLNLVLGHGTVINSKYKWLVLKNGTHDVKVSGGTFRGDFGQKQAFMITLHHAKNCSFENINFEECLIAEHVFDIGGSQNINIDHCNFSGKLANPDRDFIEAIQVDYSIYSGLGYKDEEEREACDGAACSDITATNCRFTPVYDEEGNIKYPAPMPFGNHDQFEGMYHRNITFENNYVKDCILSANDRGTDLRNGWLHFGDVKGLTVKGNRFICTNGTKVGAIRIMQNELGHKASDAKIDAPTLSHIKIDDLSDIQILDNQFEGFDATYSNEDQYGIIRIYGVKTQYSNTIVKQVIIRGNSFTDCYPKDVDPTIAPYGIDCIVLHRVDGIISDNSANNVRRLSWSDDSWLNISDNKIVNAYYVPIVSYDRYAIITNNLIHTCYGGIVTNNSSYASSGWDILKINGNIIVDVLDDLDFSDKYKSATIIISGNGKNDVTNNTLVSAVPIPYGIKVRSEVSTNIGSIVKISDNVIKGYTEAYNNVEGLSQHDNL